MFTLQHWRF